MDKPIQKFFLTLICLSFISFFILIILTIHSKLLDGYFGIIPIPFVIIFISVIILSVQDNNKKEKQNYENYKKSYPNNVKGHLVSCHICGNPRIFIRSLSYNSVFREHFCTQCGKTLYYTKKEN